MQEDLDFITPFCVKKDTICVVVRPSVFRLER